MKIVILSDSFDESNSSTRIACQMAKVFLEKNHEVDIITSTQDKAKAGKSKLNGMTVWSIYSNYNLFWRPYISLYNYQIVSSLKKILNELKPDVVHAHNIHIYLSYHALKVAKQTGAKVFLTAHDVMLFHYGKLTEFIDSQNLKIPKKFNYKISIWQQIKKAGKTYNPFRNIIIRSYLKYVNKIFAVSNALKQVLNDNNIRNVEVIQNGINVDEWAVEDKIVDDFKNKYNLGAKKIILFGGRLSETKGGRKIVLAMGEIVKKAPDANLLVIGKIDDYAKQMIDLATKLGIRDKLVFTGWLTGDLLKSAFNACDIIAVSSICFDSFPTINLEAMACQKPVIATCFGGSKEVVQNGQTGYILNPYNTKLMAEKIVDLLKNSEKARTFGQAGYERVKNELSLERQVKKTIEWYQRMFSDKRTD